MTAVTDTAPYPGYGSPPFRHSDLALIQADVDQIVAPEDGLFTEAELIDRIAWLDTLQNTLAAAQAAHVRVFGRAHVATRTASGVVEPEKLERDIAAQIGLACRVSPTTGHHYTSTARPRTRPERRSA